MNVIVNCWRLERNGWRQLSSGEVNPGQRLSSPRELRQRQRSGICSHRYTAWLAAGWAAAVLYAECRQPRAILAV